MGNKRRTPPTKKTYNGSRLFGVASGILMICNVLWNKPNLWLAILLLAIAYIWLLAGNAMEGW